MGGTFSSDKEKEKDATIVDLPANLNDKSLQPIEIKGEKCQEETKTPKDDQDKEPSSSDKEKDENADIVDSPASSNDKNLQSSEVKAKQKLKKKRTMHHRKFQKKITRQSLKNTKVSMTNLKI